MFHLLRLRDVIELEAAYLPQQDNIATSNAQDKYRPTMKDLLWHRASEKYVNKVIANQGLCLAVNEIEEYSSGGLRGNDGSAWSTVDFTAVVFRPQVGQRISATIADQDDSGITLSISFFAIFVPSHQLIANSQYDKLKKGWYVTLEDDDGSADTKIEDKVSNSAANRNYYTTGEEVLVAVDTVFVRTLADTTERLAPMEIVGSFSVANGLGPVVWYKE